MKKIIIKSIIFVCILLLIASLFSCYSEFDTLNNIRSKNEFYNNLDYLFTTEADEMIFDLVLVDNRLTIVSLNSSDAYSNQLYRITSIVSYAIEEKIFSFNKFQEYSWSYSSELSQHKYKWCIVGKEFNIQNENYNCFDFEYDGSKYSLCFIVDNDLN